MMRRKNACRGIDESRNETDLFAGYEESSGEFSSSLIFHGEYRSPISSFSVGRGACTRVWGKADLEVMFVGLVVGSLNRRWGEMGLGSTREPFCFGSLVGLCTDRPSDAYLNHRIFGEAVAIPFQTEEMMSATQLSGCIPDP